MENLEKRVAKLEKILWVITGGAAVLATYVVFALGYTALYQVEKEVAKRFADPSKEIETRLEEIRVSEKEARDILSRIGSDSSQILGSLGAAKRSYDELLAKFERADFPPNVYILGEMECGRDVEIDVPIPGTTSDDWLVFAVNWEFGSRVEGNTSLGDNSIYSVEAEFLPKNDKSGWEATLRSRVNVNSGSERLNTLWRCNNDRKVEEKYRDDAASADIVAVRAYGKIQRIDADY